jgi:penicillin-binding protein-related factor A (putative recombinase)
VVTLANRRRGGRAAKAGGESFESMIADVHALYAQQGRAYAIKTQQPMRMLGGMDKGGTFRACFTADGPPDFVVIASGRTFIIEAKRCQQKRWGFQNLKDHQAAQLDAARDQGAVGVVLVRFVGIQSRTVLLLWEELRNLWHPWRLGAGGQASLSLPEAVDIGAWTGVGADYLPGLLAALSATEAA